MDAGQSDLIQKNKVKDWRVKEVNTIAAALKRRTEPTTMGVSVNVLQLAANIAIDLTRLRDWLCSNWPGKRYRRLIQHLAISKKENDDLSKAVRRVWLNETS
jgi:hypothetical protein